MRCIFCGQDNVATGWKHGWDWSCSCGFSWDGERADREGVGLIYKFAGDYKNQVSTPEYCMAVFGEIV